MNNENTNPEPYDTPAMTAAGIKAALGNDWGWRSAIVIGDATGKRYYVQIRENRQEGMMIFFVSGMLPDFEKFQTHFWTDDPDITIAQLKAQIQENDAKWQVEVDERRLHETDRLRLREFQVPAINFKLPTMETIYDEDVEEALSSR